MKRKNGLMDQFGNYLCTLGNTKINVVWLAIPLVVALIVLIAFCVIASAVTAPVVTALEGLKLSDNMPQYIDTSIKAIRYAWIIGILMMVWQRYRGAVNAMQTTVTTVFYLSVAFTMIGKIMVDVAEKSIKTGGLDLVLYIVVSIGVLVVFCLISLVATIIGTPIAVSAGLIVGVGIDLLVNFIRAESIKQSPCFQAVSEMIQDANLKSEVAEVQLVDTGLYLVNPSAKVVNRVKFEEYQYPALNVWTRKTFLAQVMTLLPASYTLESLNNMWVANNTKLLSKIAEVNAKR